MNITLITGNDGKLAEYRALLPECTLEKVQVPQTEIQAATVAEVAKAKALEAYAHLGAPVLVDDSCMIVAAWNGLPGPFTSWFLQMVGTTGILAMAEGLEDRRVVLQTALAFCDGNEPVVVVGEVPGYLTRAPQGERGFGFDTIVCPEGSEHTFAQLTADQKNHLSMRARAAERFREEVLAA